MHPAAAFAGRPRHNQKREFICCAWPGHRPELQIWEHTPEQAARSYHYYQHGDPSWTIVYVRRPADTHWTCYEPTHTYSSRGETMPIAVGAS